MAIHDENELQLRAQMGTAALIPGVVFVLERVQHILDELRGQLSEMQAAARSAEAESKALEVVAAPSARRVRRQSKPRVKSKPRGKIAAGKRPKSGWPDDPEERKAEMARRVKVARSKRKAEALSAAHKKHWASMSVRQRKARLVAMQAGKQQHVNGEALAS